MKKQKGETDGCAIGCGLIIGLLAFLLLIPEIIPRIKFQWEKGIYTKKQAWQLYMEAKE